MDGRRRILTWLHCPRQPSCASPVNHKAQISVSWSEIITYGWPGHARGRFVQHASRFHGRTVRCSPDPANGPDLSSEASMVLSPISPERRQRVRCLLESANGPDLSRGASIGIAWTTNKLYHLRFVAQFYAYIFSGNEGLPCCSPLRSANHFSTPQSPRGAD